jgi:hypothetical protein
MKNTRTSYAATINTLSHIDGVRIGRIVEISRSGQILVDFPANKLGPIAARLTSTVIVKLHRTKSAGKEVLIAFENNDPELPVIVDTLYSLLDDVAEQTGIAFEIEKPDDVLVDVRKITFNAKEEIVLKCGKASITLTRAGKVIIRGDDLLSRSSGLNCIKGGSVQVN